MKFNFFWISLIIIVFSFPSICFSEQPDSKTWESFDNNWYYNKTNITKSSDITSVWVYRIVTNDKRKEKIEIVKKDDLEKSIKYQNFDHYLGLWEIDSKNNQRRLNELIDYDDKGNVLDSFKNIDSEWKNILPNSVFEKLSIKVCVTQKEPLVKEPLVNEPLAKEPLITPKIPDSKVWEYFSNNVYYKKTKFTKSSNIISVWTYNIVTDDFRKQKIEMVKKNDLNKSIKYQHYDHNVVLWEIDCKKRLTRTKKFIDYDNNGKVLYSYTYNNREWKNIPPDSTGDGLYQKLCATQKGSVEKK